MTCNSSAWISPQQDPADPAGRTRCYFLIGNLKWLKGKINGCRALPAAPGLERHPSPPQQMAGSRGAGKAHSVLPGWSDPSGDVLKLQFMVFNLSGGGGVVRPSDSRGPVQTRQRKTNATCKARRVCHWAKEHHFTGLFSLNRVKRASKCLPGFRLLSGKQTHWLVEASPSKGTKSVVKAGQDPQNPALWTQKPPFLAKVTCCVETVTSYSQINGCPLWTSEDGLHISSRRLVTLTVSALVMNYASVSLLGFFSCLPFLKCL